jgi:hypothetical protein
LTGTGVVACTGGVPVHETTALTGAGSGVNVFRHAPSATSTVVCSLKCTLFVRSDMLVAFDREFRRQADSRAS